MPNACIGRAPIVEPTKMVAGRDFRYCPPMTAGSPPDKDQHVEPNDRIADYPVTPDGRYFVVRGRLWRMSDPALPDTEKQSLVAALMDARRAVQAAKRADDNAAMQKARTSINQAKHALGERGPVWWNDGAADCNRHMARNTPYAGWFASLG